MPKGKLSGHLDRADAQLPEQQAGHLPQAGPLHALLSEPLLRLLQGADLQAAVLRPVALQGRENRQDALPGLQADEGVGDLEAGRVEHVGVGAAGDQEQGPGAHSGRWGER